MAESEKVSKKFFSNCINKIKIYIPTIIAIFQVLAANIINLDRYFFDKNINVPNMIFIKILYLIFAIIVWNYIFWIAKEFKNHNPLVKRGVKLFIIYFTLMMILMFILWPGTWFFDDIIILSCDFHYNYNAWQHILSSIEHLLFLQILPFPAGIIIIKNLCISVCVAFIITKIENCYNLFLKYSIFDYILKLAPFLSLPVLFYQFTGFRMGLCIYLELTTLVMMLCAIKNKENWSYTYFSLFVFLGAIVINWRSENLFYLPIFLILLFSVKTLNKKNIRLIFASILLIFSSTIGNFEQKSLVNDNYKIVATIRPITQILRATNKVKYKTQIDDINKVIKTKLVYEFPNLNGEELMWHLPVEDNIIRDNYSKLEFLNYLHQYFFLITKYPKTFLSERLTVYRITYNHLVGTYPSRELYYESDISNFDWHKRFISHTWIFNRPILPYLRYTSLQLLDEHFSKYQTIYSHTIPIIFIIFFSIYLTFCKRYKELLLTIGVLIKVPIVFSTEPVQWFMYWITFHLIGYFILYYFILYLLSEKKPRQEQT